MKKLSLLIVTGAVIFWALGTVMAGDTKNKPTQRAVFKVENMTCGACFTHINAGLSPLSGFSGMGVNLFRNLVAVDFIGPLSADKIEAAITKSGYPATLVSVDPIMEKASFAYLNTRQREPDSGGGCCSGGKSAVASQNQSPLPQTPSGLARPGIPHGIQEVGSCCSLPGGSQLPPATTN